MLCPTSRIRTLADLPPRPGARYVLYWMIASRRLAHSWALDRAAQWCRELGLPLLVFEPLRVDHEWASERFHTFVLQGMRNQAAEAATLGLGYYPYVEPTPGASRGLLRALAAEAAVVVTDDWPSLDLPDLVARAARGATARFEAIDGNGVAPLSASPQPFSTAHAFRGWLQQRLADDLAARPSARPLDEPVLRGATPPAAVRARWPEANLEALLSGGLSRLPLDRLAPGPTVGGRQAGLARWRTFLSAGLPNYLERNHPDDGASSGLSPYLHWGHLAGAELVADVLAAEDWSPERLGRPRKGSREGFWGLSPPATAFLDQVITWRELGFHEAHHRFGLHRSYEGLPTWARASLEAHDGERTGRYRFEQLDEARTADPVWNAAQRELRATGVVHNAVRMIWGKRILEWAPSAREAFDWLVRLNDRYALDGRDPNSYTGIAWSAGKFDRPWGPVRPVFGTVRFMSSELAPKKWRMARYLERWGAERERPC